MKYIYIIICSLIIYSCGFKPIYKIDENNLNLVSYDVVFINEDNVSRPVKEEVNRTLINNANNKDSYTVEIKVSENFIPLIVNTNGTVAKYRIELTIKYNLFDSADMSEILSDTVRGFAQFDTAVSEIENNDKKDKMIRLAARDAIQIMMTKIQGNILKNNDN